MNRRVQGILAIAFVIAAVCSYAVWRAFANRMGSSQQPKTTQIVVAANDMKIGSVLHDADLGTAEFQGDLPKGAIVNRQDALNRGVISDLYKGEPVLESRLAVPGAGGGLAALIPNGMRACAVKVDEVVGVAGFVTPGMKVDVLISGNPPGATDNSSGPKVKTLLQNIKVLSAGTDIQRDGEGKPQQVQVVNLLVTPEQAEYLSLASSQTRIQLVLRNPLDTEIAEPPGTTVSTLYQDKNAPPPPPKPRVVVPAVAAPHVEPKKAPEQYVIQVYNGSKQSEQKFGPSEGK